MNISEHCATPPPMALPWADISCPFGAHETERFHCPNGAKDVSPWQRHGRWGVVALGATAMCFIFAATLYAQPQPRDTVIRLDKKPQPIVGVTNVLQYPEDAKRAGIEGSVTVKFKVLRNCTTDSVTVLKSDHPMLANAAVEAIKKCKYLPALKNKQIVEEWTVERVNFKLH